MLPRGRRPRTPPRGPWPPPLARLELRAPPLAADPDAEPAVAAARDGSLASAGGDSDGDVEIAPGKWRDRHGNMYEDHYCGPPGGPYDPALGNTERFDAGCATLDEIREHWARRNTAARGQAGGGPSTAAARAASSGPSEPPVAAARDFDFPADGADIPVDPEEAARDMNAAAAAAKEALDKLVAERGGVENLLLMLLEEPLPFPLLWPLPPPLRGAGSRLQGVRRRHGGPAPGDGPALQPGDAGGARPGPAGSAGDGREPRPG